MHPKRPPPAQTPDGLVLVPSSKRQHVDAAGIGGGVVPAQPALTSPPGKRQLRPSMLVLFFVVQVKEELRYNRRLRRVIRQENAISQKRTLEVFQKTLDNACQNLVNHINCSLQSLTKQTDILRHEVEQIKHSNSNQRYRSEANEEHAADIEEVNQEQTAVRFATSEAHEGQGFELRFLNKLNDHVVYTKDKITAEDCTDIKIAIFRDNQIVTSGQFSSARIEVLVLHDKFYHSAPDNWTECEFNDHIISSSEGPVLGGGCQVKMKNGEASLSDISFNVPSSKTGSKKLILAARVLTSDKAGFQIKEAVMNPVEVQVNRNKVNKKSDRPKLKDELHRLKGISGKGYRIQWLKDNQINTVEEFIKALNKDEEKIRTECFKLKKDNQLWKYTVKHAEECDLEGNCKLKSYESGDKKVILFFNCVHDLVGAKFLGFYVTKDNFNSDQQDEVNRLKKQAYDQLDNVNFDYEMEDNHPVSLSSTLNTSIGGDASIPMTNIAGLNPPVVTSQVQGTAEVETAHHGPSVAEQIPSEQTILPGYEGNQEDVMTPIGREYFQAAQPPEALPEITEDTSNLIGPRNEPQNVSDDSTEEWLDLDNWPTGWMN